MRWVEWMATTDPTAAFALDGWSVTYVGDPTLAPVAGETAVKWIAMGSASITYAYQDAEYQDPDTDQHLRMFTGGGSGSPNAWNSLFMPGIRFNVTSPRAGGNAQAVAGHIGWSAMGLQSWGESDSLASGAVYQAGQLLRPWGLWATGSSDGLDISQGQTILEGDPVEVSASAAWDGYDEPLSQGTYWTVWVTLRILALIKSPG